MITKLTAEFDSVETAELAARMIKQRTDGIVSINIHRKSIPTAKSPVPYVIPSFSQSSNFYFIVGNNNYLDSVNDSSDDDRISKSAIIEIICEKESEKTVSQIITSLNGLKFNKN